jgi:protocatechuate 3,4-dioxygenase beta subunit
MYSSGAQTQNYLRGVQVSDANGEVTFTTTFPGCYPAADCNLHFGIYHSLAQASSGRN